MKNRGAIITIWILVFLINSISAYDLGIVRQGECIDLYQHCSDCSFVNVTSVKFPNQTISYFNVAMDKNGYDFTYNFCENNQSGDYFYTVCGDPTGKDPCKTFSYGVTESGVEMTQARSLSSLGLLIILCIFFFVSLYSLFAVEDYRGKFALYWVSHILMILTTFVGWQIGVEGLLSGLAITGIFKILFWFFLISAFPMLILSLAWIFYIHTFNEHFEKLIDKGVDTETAFKLAKKKSRGWFNGK